jgi:D-isomer specific 2-hydroxyacid dehydrogenase, catalytic domain/D-isomer specific 2-hydroxyacid dehydrogenase, NAD binding domain
MNIFSHSATTPHFFFFRHHHHHQQLWTVLCTIMFSVLARSTTTTVGSRGGTASSGGSLLLVRAFSATTSKSGPTAPATTDFRPLPVDIEHYTEGWNVQDISDFTKKGQYTIYTFNKISPKGLGRFPDEYYNIQAADTASGPAHAILLRSHKLQEGEVDVSVRAIARCGAGTNNIPVARMTELGIPVFNTPGANANAVKELILCGMLLGSRRVVDGVNHMRQLGAEGAARERVEKDKSRFGGREIRGKTLAVIGLGHIGAATARDATALGMSVQVSSFLSCVLSWKMPPCARRCAYSFFCGSFCSIRVLSSSFSLKSWTGIRPGPECQVRLDVAP